MGVKYMAAWAVSGSVLLSAGTVFAGAEEGDKATEQQLKQSGTEMVPSEQLRKPKPKPPPVKSTEEAPPPPPAEPMPPQPKQAAPIMPAPEPEPAVAGLLAAPYLRADIGFGFSNDPDGSQSTGAMTAEDSGNFGMFSGGGGIRFNRHFRSDVTFAYRPDTDIESTSAAGNTNNTEVDSISVMLNAYMDLGSYEKVVPYVGAGIGYSRLSTGTLTTTGGNASETGESADNFAYALMAGAAVEIADGTSLDLGYRFINLGGIEQSGEFSNGTTAQATEFDDLIVHEVKAGLRVTF